MEKTKEQLEAMNDAKPERYYIRLEQQRKRGLYFNGQTVEVRK